MTVYSPTRRAIAYVNWGRWVSDCPAGCGSAQRLEPGQDVFTCAECGQLALIAWPADADRIWFALTARILPRNRNWFPAGHPLALAANCPHGQGVDDLMAESFEHEGAL
jgi:hypothetical protein